MAIRHCLLSYPGSVFCNEFHVLYRNTEDIHRRIYTLQHCKTIFLHNNVEMKKSEVLEPSFVFIFVGLVDRFYKNQFCFCQHKNFSVLRTLPLKYLEAYKKLPLSYVYDSV